MGKILKQVTFAIASEAKTVSGTRRHSYGRAMLFVPMGKFVRPTEMDHPFFMPNRTHRGV